MVSQADISPFDEAPRWNEEIEGCLKLFPIHVLHNNQITKTTWHRQPGVEIHLTHEGRAAFLSGGHTILQRHRDVMVHAADNPHRFLTLTNHSYRRSVICIDYGDFDGLELHPLLQFFDAQWIASAPFHHLHLDVASYTKFSRLCELMVEEIAESQPGWQQLMLAHAMEALVILQRSKNESGGRQKDPQEIPEIIQLCLNIIEQRLDEDLSLKYMAKRLSISEEHLSRAFCKEAGVGYHRYVSAKRIDAARAMLMDERELSIMDVALRVGFSSVSHFSRSFKQWVGQTPSQFRHNPH